ncbi:7-carboxy-7-deazaguanine synthase QueE [Candidatus Peregrinibacteria bacterium]|nr:7-carboxy-7-deazaguanine synthase QueE [Candidatus Peregrinibacteria bacterium]
MNILLNEIFHSIQGEGPAAGGPAIFVRLSGCNLQCMWCDTKYAWAPEGARELDEIVRAIRKYPCKHLVITGGEPLLQQTAIAALLKALPEYTTEIETNGSIACRITGLIEQLNCSPKLKNSGNKPYELKILPLNKKAIYKFVVGGREDIKEIKNFIKKYKIPQGRVWLMPEGVTKKAIEKKSKWLVEVCKKEGYNFTTRLQVLLYGNKRGV